MKEIVQSQIKQIREELPFSESEISILRSIREKKLFYLITSYLALVGLLIYGYFDARARWYSEYDEEEQGRFETLWPYFFGVFFVALTVFFINYYFRLVRPYVKDIKNGMKEIIYFKADIYKTPFFSEYFIITPVKKRRRIRINTEMCKSIQTTGIASLTLAPYSSFVFEIDVGKSEIKFNETNEPIDS